MQVFFSYAPDDEERVEPYYQRLAEMGLKPWMESRDFVVGQKREWAFRKAMQQSDYILVFLSNHAVTTAGFFHKAVSMAFDVFSERPEGENSIIRLRLEDCKVPTKLESLYAIDLFEANGWNRLLRALQAEMERLQPGSSSHITAPARFTNSGKQISSVNDATREHAPLPSVSPSINTPPQQSMRQLSLSAVHQFVELLLACPSIQDSGTRSSMLGMLAPHIQNSISNHAQNKVHVLNIVNACQNYPGGLEALVESLRFFESNSYPMQAIDTFLSSLSQPSVAPLAGQTGTHPTTATGVTTTSTSSVVSIKRKQLEQELAQLTQEYEALGKQLGFALGAVEKVRIQRQLKDIEDEMVRVEQEMNGSSN